MYPNVERPIIHGYIGIEEWYVYSTDGVWAMNLLGDIWLTLSASMN